MKLHSMCKRIRKQSGRIRLWQFCIKSKLKTHTHMYIQYIQLISESALLALLKYFTLFITYHYFLHFSDSVSKIIIDTGQLEEEIKSCNCRTCMQKCK